MKTIDIFYQAEGLREIAHLECGADENYTALKDAIGKKHGLGDDAFIFLEDADKPVDLKEAALKPSAKGGVKIHVHRCREVKVSVTFNGETVQHPFTPATTIAKVKKWAAERKFGMTEEEAGEHVLQITGRMNGPRPTSTSDRWWRTRTAASRSTWCQTSGSTAHPV